MPESFACAVAGTAKRTAVMSSPQALIVFNGFILGGLDMDASRRLWTDLYAYSLAYPHARPRLRTLLEELKIVDNNKLAVWSPRNRLKDVTVYFVKFTSPSFVKL